MRGLDGRVRLGGAQHREPVVADQLEVGLRGLALGGEVVAEEDRVGDLQGQRLQRAEALLPVALRIPETPEAGGKLRLAASVPPCRGPAESRAIG